MKIDISPNKILYLLGGIFTLLPVFAVIDFYLDDQTALIIMMSSMFSYFTLLIIIVIFSPRYIYRCKETNELAITRSFCRTHKEVNINHFNKFKIFRDNKTEEILSND